MGDSYGVPSFGLRVVGALAALFIFACGLIVLLLSLEALGAEQGTVLFVGKALTYTGFGAVVIGWKWPYALLRPAKRLLQPLKSASGPQSSSEASLLRSPIQRALFVGGCFALVPWVGMRLFREIWRSAGVDDYLRNVLVAPLAPWFESGWWWHTKLEWYDWPVLPALVALALAYLWPYTGARIVEWIRSGR